MNLRTPLTVLGLSLAVLGVAPAVSAHISLEQGGTHLSRYGDGALKAGPCGRAGGARGTHVYTYEPGEKVTVKVVEYIPHPSYYRWAFDADGDDAFVEPASIKPIDPKRPCPLGEGDHCGASDFYNSPSVLPGMDNLFPHLTAKFGETFTFELTMPDVECDNCTLQVIQVMEDHGPHGNYDPAPGVGVEDIYHQCIDIVLKRGPGSPASSDAGVDPGPSVDADGGATAGTSSGAPGAGATGNTGSTGTTGTTGTTGEDGGGCSATRGASRAPLGVSAMAVVGVAVAVGRRRRSRRGASRA